MPEPLSLTAGIFCLGYASLQGRGRFGGNAVSHEAIVIGDAMYGIVEMAERSQALFGAKSAAISQLSTLENECSEDGWDGGDAYALNPFSIYIAKQFLRALPQNLPIPEFSPEPDGSVSVDWIISRNRIFSLSIGNNHRIAAAWLEGTEQGHFVFNFSGYKIPEKVLDGIREIVGYGDAPFRIA
jgi:hypothetical protein